MNKLLPVLLLSSVYSVRAISAEKQVDPYFSAGNPVFTPQEKSAIAISERWMALNGKESKPVPGSDGTVLFIFGAQRPSIVCAVLQICDLALQAGEQVHSINLGDTARWLVEPAVTGSGSGEVQHLIIKPLDVGLETSMVVTTNRRTYHIQLRSHRTRYMPKVAFTYPEEALAKWNAVKARETKIRQDHTIPETGEYLGELNFDYQVMGKAAWKPVRVYNNGVKTIIQMPSTMGQTEAPALLVIRKGRNMLTRDETVMVNYRVQGDRYIVDAVFDEAILIAGVGAHQDRVTIRRSK